MAYTYEAEMIVQCSRCKRKLVEMVALKETQIKSKAFPEDTVRRTCYKINETYDDKGRTYINALVTGSLCPGCQEEMRGIVKDAINFLRSAMDGKEAGVICSKTQ